MKRASYFLTAALMCQAALVAQTPAGASAFQAADWLNAGRGGRGAAPGNTLPVPRAETGKPFSATAITQTTQTYSDGTRVSQTTSMLQYRDADGRVRTETSERSPGSSEPVKSITIRDPVAGTTYRLDPVRKTADKLAAIASPAAAGVPGGRGGGAGARGGRAPGSTLDPAAQARVMESYREMVGASQAARNNPNDTVEDLGMLAVNGIPARGTRTTTVVPVGAIGNDREFRSVSERWFSPDLNLLIKSVSTDPRFGTTTFELTNISRHAPDPSLFQVPADYKQSPPALPPNVIEGIEFSGMSRVPQDTLRSTILSKAGDVYDEEAVRRDFTALWKTNRFSDVQVKKEPGARGGVIVRFVVTERP